MPLMNRAMRAALGKETLGIVESGRYTLADGRTISLADDVTRCLEATRLLSPSDLRELRDAALSRPQGPQRVSIEVENETTLAGAGRLLRERAGPVAALNFASARNPGGG